MGGPVARSFRAISEWAKPLPYKIVRNMDGEVHHFLSFAEMYRAVRRGYDLQSDKIKIATLYHLEKRRRHRHFKAAFDACHYICVVSNEWKARLVDVEGVDPSKIRVIYSGVVSSPCFLDENPPPEPMRPMSLKEKLDLRNEFGIPERAFVVGHIGREDSWRKGSEIFYEALDKLGHSVFPVFFSDSSYRRGVKDISKYGYHRYRDFYNMMDAYVITAKVEGGPVGFIEAVACGIPVVSSKVGTALDFQVYELLYQTVDELVDRINFVKSGLAKELTQTLHEKMKWLTWEWHAKEYYKLYDEAVGRYLDKK